MILFGTLLALGGLAGVGVALWAFLRPDPAPIDPAARFRTRCEHGDALCRRYGCPTDPAWRGNGCS